jgi:hypothetical protein
MFCLSAVYRTRQVRRQRKIVRLGHGRILLTHSVSRLSRGSSKRDTAFGVAQASPAAAERKGTSRSALAATSNPAMAASGAKQEFPERKAIFG